MVERSRRGVWIVTICAAMFSIAVAAVVCWMRLPVWAPRFVAERSPWLDPVVRAHAVHGGVGIPADVSWGRFATDDLAVVLHHPHHAVRESLIRHLGTRYDPRLGASFLRIAGDSDQTVRMALAQSIGANRNQFGLPALLLLIDDPSSWVRWRAADALGSFAGPDIDRALARANSDAVPQVADAAREAMRRNRSLRR